MTNGSYASTNSRITDKRRAFSPQAKNNGHQDHQDVYVNVVREGTYRTEWIICELLACMITINTFYHSATADYNVAL